MYIDVVREAKPFIKAGSLRGTFFLRLRVTEVNFEDGSVWSDDEVLEHHSKFGAARYRAAQLRKCPNKQCLFHENGQGYCEANNVGTLCRRELCSPDDPNACVCNLYSCATCKDLDGDAWSDCEGDCWDEANNVDAFNTHPGADETCDGFDNDCNGQIDDNCTTPTPSPTPPPNCSFNELGDPGDFSCGHCWDNDDNDCDGFKDFSDSDCYTCYPSPVLIDVLGNGFDLTSAAAGVNFDLNTDGIRESLSWTAAGSDDAWLALDRNGNGVIDNGQELFGNFTPQPEPPAGEEKKWLPRSG